MIRIKVITFAFLALTAGSSPGVPVGAPPIPTADFDVSTALVHSTVPRDDGVDPVGAFRFICGAGQLSYDDPILFPGQPGRSHLHQYYGNLDTNAYSTYATQRAHGDSTCGSSGLEDGKGYAANRSGYWMPALLDGRGNVIKPDFVSIYYKRLPASAEQCSQGGRGKNLCVAIPNGIKFTFGYDMLKGASSGHHHFACVAKNKPIATSPTLAGIAATGCPAGDRVEAMISAPQCWDGVNLDSRNHRSHVAYLQYGGRGYARCPIDHPYLMPTFTLGAFYTVQPGDDLRLWRYSSDEMRPGIPAGTTLHADYLEAWDPGVKAEWTEHCIDGHLSCSGGNLGDGHQLKHAWSAVYDGKPTNTNPHARVPVPTHRVDVGSERHSSM